MDAKEARRRDRFEQLGTAAANDALASSGLEITEANAGRIGVLVSSAIGGIKSLQDAVITNYTEGPRRVSPFLIPMLMPNGAAGMIAIDHQIKGPCFSVASACALRCRWDRHRHVDVESWDDRCGACGRR